MLKEYRTITEVVGPLMLVEQVEGAKFNELVEIEQANGEIREAGFLRWTETKLWYSCLKVLMD